MTPFTTGLIFVAANIMLWLSVLIVQTFESRTKRIPPRARWGSSSPFLYFQDWNMAVWGDLVGLSILNFVAGYFLSAILANMWAVSISCLIGLAASVIFHLSRLSPRHRPDAGYPGGGKVSTFGYAHIVYFFMQSSLCAAVSTLALAGVVQGTLLTFAILGGLIYILTYTQDWSAGKLKLINAE